MGTFPEASITAEKGIGADQLKRTRYLSASCPMILAESPIAVSFGSFPGLYSGKCPVFHLLAFPTTQYQVQEACCANARMYSLGEAGSRQKTSIRAPVSFLKNILAGTTLVLLKTIRLSGGNNAEIS